MAPEHPTSAHPAPDPSASDPPAPRASLADKAVFTTGEAAELCKVSQQTIIRCFDAGRLHGFRVPGSRFRRIPREQLLKFMRANDIPTDTMGRGPKRVLVVDDDPRIVELFMDLFGADQRLEVRGAATGYEAGMLTESFQPDLMILDFMLPDVNGNVVCERVRQSEALSGMKIVVVSGVVHRGEVDSLLEAGADLFVKKPFDTQQLMTQVQTLLEL